MHAFGEYGDSYVSGYFVNRRSRAAAKSLNFLESPSNDSIVASVFLVSLSSDEAKAETALLNKGSFQSIISASIFTKLSTFRVWLSTCRDGRDLVSDVLGVIGCKDTPFCSYKEK